MVTVRGQTATLRWGYLQAAELTAYAITNDEHGVWTMTATIVNQHELYVQSAVAAGRLMLVAPHANGAWRWPVLTLQIAGATLTATLGPRERQ